ncbi:MAG: Rhodanese-like domain protein [Acidobacteria bacterium]|jgi:predicted sulfurtransferase|nr:Rhodanese-like domain protein [Acidobacteriota bacterium]
MRYFLSTIVALAFGLSFLTSCQNAAAPVKVEQAKTNTNNSATASKTDEHGHPDGAPRITLAEAKKDFDAGNAVFIDTRAEAAFKQERIKGAINISMESFEAKYKDIPAGKKIIAYCS